MMARSRRLKIDWGNDERDLAAIYGTFDVLLGLVDERLSASECRKSWSSPLSFNADSLERSFIRLLGDPLPPAIDRTSWAEPATIWRNPDNSRLSDPSFETLRSDVEDDVECAAHEAAVALLLADQRVADVLAPGLRVMPAQRAGALDLLVGTALRAAVNRAHAPRIEQYERALATPRLPDPMLLVLGEPAESWYRGAAFVPTTDWLRASTSGLLSRTTWGIGWRSSPLESRRRSDGPCPVERLAAESMRTGTTEEATRAAKMM